MVPRVLIIAGSDSGGGAGIQADIKTVTMLGGFAMTAITAITAQNSLGVDAVHSVPTEIVLKQIEAVVSDIGVDVVKIGMIGSAETAQAVAERLGWLPGVPVVFDPVMVASSGAELADKVTVAAFRRLMDEARLVTPNSAELGALTRRTITTTEEAVAAAVELAHRHEVSVLAKGGHVSGAEVIDVLVEPNGHQRRWSAPRIETQHDHGTGCTLASAIATCLGHGGHIWEAVETGRNYVRATMQAAPGFGSGHGPMGHALGTVPFEVIHRKED